MLIRTAGSALRTVSEILLPALLLCTHLFLTIRLGFPQRHIRQGIADSVRGGGFSALAVQLAATLGVGNIVGIAAAVVSGGPGAVFWCWISGTLGIAATYAEARMTLESRRGPDAGPWSAMSRHLGLFYAAVIAAGGLLIGSAIPASAISDILTLPRPLSAVILTLVTAAAALGGAAWLQRACERIVPLIALLYVCACTAILLISRSCILWALRAIFTGAFSPQAAAGGMLGGLPVAAAVRYGVSRGLFSNEAGLGTAGIAAAALPPGDPHRQAMVSATATFWDTTVFCGVTGLAFVSAVRFSSALPSDAAALCAQAFSLIPGGKLLLQLCILLLGLACIFGWCCIGMSAFRHAAARTPERLYACLWTAAAAAGALFPSESVFRVSDLLNAAAICPILYTLWRYYGLDSMICTS